MATYKKTCPPSAGRSEFVVLALKVATIIAVAYISSAFAQDRPKVRLVVERLSAGAEECGVTTSTLSSIAVLTARNNGISIVDDFSSPYYMYINVNSMVTIVGGRKVGCNTQADVDVRFIVLPDNVPGPLKSRGNTRGILCSSGELLTTNMATSGSAILRSVEESIKICLGKLDY